jgi:hypothetical protein
VVRGRLLSLLPLPLLYVCLNTPLTSTYIFTVHEAVACMRQNMCTTTDKQSIIVLTLIALRAYHVRCIGTK